MIKLLKAVFDYLDRRFPPKVKISIAEFSELKSKYEKLSNFESRINSVERSLSDIKNILEGKSHSVNDFENSRKRFVNGELKRNA